MSHALFGNGFLPQFNPWNYFKLFWEAWGEAWRPPQPLDQRRLEKEAMFQLELAQNPGATPGLSEEELVTRLMKNGPALRPFLDHNRRLIDMPLAHGATERRAQATAFIRDFHDARRAVQRTLHASPATFEDELSEVLSGSPILYQQVAGFHNLSSQGRRHVASQLAGKLRQRREKHPQQQQMG